VEGKQYYPAFISLFKKNILKLALRFNAVAIIVANIFGIDTTNAG
jgi:hypothetical protein